MASLEVTGLDELESRMLLIGAIPDDVMTEALGKMAEVAASEIRDQGETMGVRDPESSVHILDKIKPVKAKQGKDGWHQDITFTGSRTRGKERKSTPNAEIAFVQEYGKRGQQARPFIGTAMEANADEITETGWKIVGDWIETTFES